MSVRGFEHKERQIAKPTIVEPNSVKPIRQTDLRHTAYRDRRCIEIDLTMIADFS
jgi:hypothetical protein